jgi:hypothetical protein
MNTVDIDEPWLYLAESIFHCYLSAHVTIIDPMISLLPALAQIGWEHLLNLFSCRHSVDAFDCVRQGPTMSQRRI